MTCDRVLQRHRHPERLRLGNAHGGLQSRPRHGHGGDEGTPPTGLGDRPGPAGATVSSDHDQVTATAADNVGVAGVQFLLDGKRNLGAEDTTAPYSIAWDTTATNINGSHSLSARARGQRPATRPRHRRR